MYVKKMHHVKMSSIKKMHTKENWFLFFCLTVYYNKTFDICTYVQVRLESFQQSDFSFMFTSVLFMHYFTCATWISFCVFKFL